MENKELTAVEWLIDRIYDVDLTEEMFEKIKKQALELEKGQHNRTYLDGAFEMELKTGKSFGQYYNETYGNKEK